LLTLVDVIIVDAQSDLNIYTEAARQARNDKEGTDASGEAAGSGCCGASPVVDGKKITPWDLADIDINEWAGKFVLFEMYLG
jgi:hypothetical protein